MEAGEPYGVKPFGLTCAMMSCRSIPDGLNRDKNHERIIDELHRNIDFAAAEGIPNVICMAGNRAGLNDDEGLEMCAKGLKKIVGHAEKMKVTNVCLFSAASRAPDTANTPMPK